MSLWKAARCAARYSIIGLSPDLSLTVQGARAFLKDSFSGKTEESDDPLRLIREALDRSAVPAVEGLPPMSAGVFGFMGYDMVRLMERLPAAKPDPIGVPDAVLVRPTIMVIFDAVKTCFSSLPWRVQSPASQRAPPMRPLWSALMRPFAPLKARSRWRPLQPAKKRS